MRNVVIQNIQGLEIIDSRGNPTVEAHVTLSDGAQASAAVPSGASTGIREAVELRDNDQKRYVGKGTATAVSNVNSEIAAALAGKSPFDQQAVDTIMIDLDGTQNKGRLGANAILAVSMAVAKSAANSNSKELFEYLGQEDNFELPIPFFNILNGGAHANNAIDIQEFMIVPSAMTSFSEALRCGVEIYQTLKKSLNKQGYSTAVGDEGGFAPNLKSNTEVLDVIVDAICEAGYVPGTEVSLALDVASSELWNEDKYELKSEGLFLDSAEFVGYLENLVNTYPIVSIEDGMAEQDWKGWKLLTDALGSKIQLVGDDVFVTDSKLLSEGVQAGIANSILIKLNQIGTVSETLETINIAKQAGYWTMISHRSGETEDTTIADLAVATNAGQIKSGAPCRSDRTAKYNRLLRIENKYLLS